MAVAVNARCVVFLQFVRTTRHVRDPLPLLLTLDISRHGLGATLLVHCKLVVARRVIILRSQVVVWIVLRRLIIRLLQRILLLLTLLQLARLIVQFH